MKLIILSCAHLLEKEHVIINSLLEAGVLCLHLRKPFSKAELLERIIRRIHPAYLRRIVLHQHHQLAFKFGLGGVHFSEAERISMQDSHRAAVVQKVKANHMTMSTSVHSKEALAQIHKQFDYVFFSPVFNSISKPGYGPATDMSIRNIQIKAKVIGLGGVNAGNISKLKQMGYDGAAVLGAVWQEPEKAVEHFIKIQQTCQNNALMS